MEGLADAAAVEIVATPPIEPTTAMKTASILLRIKVSPFGSCERSSKRARLEASDGESLALS